MSTSKMARVAVLPVGEFDGSPAKEGFHSIVKAFDRARTDLLVLPVGANEAEARRSVQEFLRQDAVLLAIIVSQGLSARTIEAAARLSHMPCLVLPLQGNY